MIRAVIFDFNGTLSADEPILYGIYAGLFAEHGRPLSEADYYDQLAGLSDPEIVHRWLGRRDDAEHVVSQRVTRYREAVADGATIGPAVRRGVAFAAARVPVARFCRCSIKARAKGSVKTRAGRWKVMDSLRPICPAPSRASSTASTSRPA